MSAKVTVNSSSPYRVTINSQQQKTVRSIAVAPTTSFASLTDVDVSDADNNETIVYDSASGKYVVKTLPSLDGGTF